MLTELDYQLLAFSIIALLSALVAAAKEYQRCKGNGFIRQPRAKYQREK